MIAHLANGNNITCIGTNKPHQYKDQYTPPVQAPIIYRMLTLIISYVESTAEKFNVNYLSKGN